METSPHTRGKRRDAILKCLKARNIPAYAGKALRSHCGRGGFGKHPRIRGESSFGRIAAADSGETSPHTRGKPTRQRFVQPRCRNIPAYAGKASSPSSISSSARKHPRIRGESHPASRSANSILETSPHTRGKRVEISIGGSVPGNIPAYAGKAKQLRN